MNKMMGKKIEKKVKQKRFKSKSLIVLGIIIVIIISGAVIENRNIIGSFLGMKKKVTTSSSPEVDINYGNIEQAFSGSSIVKDLPKDSVVLLRFYNFENGEEVWEKSYILEKEGVKEGYTDEADIILLIPSEYLVQLTNKNFCGTIQAAKSNEELGIRTELSTAKLLWRFKSMFPHRKCLGF